MLIYIYFILFKFNYISYTIDMIDCFDLFIYSKMNTNKKEWSFDLYVQANL